MITVPRKYQFGVLIACWALAAGFGLHSLLLYKGKPGMAGQTPQTWPTNKLISLSADKPLVVMFAHPRCPCTKASLAELEVLAAKANGQFEATVLFYEPETSSEAWSKTASIDFARSIPGVRVVVDKEGRVANRFAVETSGHTVVYNSGGKLLFSGGITGARGHIGDNEGLDAVLEWVGKGSAQTSKKTADVFGCELFNECTFSHISAIR